VSSKLLTPTTDPATITAAPLPSASASGLPATRGSVTMLVDLKETFTAMYSALKGARKRVLICAWFLHIDTLIDGGRNPPKLVDQLRELVQKRVEVNVLLSFIEGQAFPGATTARKIRERLRAGLSKGQLQFLKVQVGFHPATVQGHRIGTYHEKLIIVDGAVAFCGGLEFNKAYAKPGPHRHDVHCRVEGPAVPMLERHFVAIWNAASKRAEKEKLAEGRLSIWPDESDAGKTAQAVQWVFTAGADGTSAIDPYHNDVTEVFDSYAAAIDAAQNLIYIENQYFRSDELTKLLAARLKKNKQLEIIVLIPSAPEEDLKDPITRFAVWLSNQQIKALTQDVGSEKPRIGFFSLCDGRTRFPYVHSKMMIVDDKWLTVGSANANARGFFLDFEANLVVRDDDTARLFRRRLWKEHLGADTDWRPGAGSALDLWLKAATRNSDAIRRGQRATSSVIEHRYDAKVARPTDQAIEDKLKVPGGLRPLLRPSLNRVLRELALEPELEDVDDTRMA
jgi:phosphatidylserine/phosphatidylglycerophosphate/cardiolipin synthase-like enzyme